MLRIFIQCFAVVTTAESAFFLAKGSFALSAPAIAQQAGTRLDYNRYVVEALAQQVANYCVGVIFLGIALILRGVNVVWPIRWVDLRVSVKGILVSVGVGIVSPLFTRICSGPCIHAARRRRRVAVAFWTLSRRYS